MFSAWMLAGGLACLSAGCASSSRPNARIYDRYAEMLAAQNRAMQAPANAPAAPAPASRPVSKPADLADRRLPKAEPAAVPVQPPPVQVVAPKPPAPPPADVPKPAPAPAKTVPTPASIPAVPAAPETPAAVNSTSVDGAYTLKVGDGIQVYLRGIPMADVIEDIIDENGKISLPLVNEVQAAGLTASDLERSIRKTYLDQDIYRNITVNVVVPTRYYFIQGEIRAPGRFQIMSATRVSQAIAGAGGYTEFASGQVVVKRGGQVFKTIRNARKLERVPEDDILLEPDDIVEVKRSLW